MHILALQPKTDLFWSLAPKEQQFIALKNYFLPLLTEFLLSPLYLLKGNHVNGGEVSEGELALNLAQEMSLKL